MSQPTLYQDRDSPLHRAHPLTTLSLTIAFLVIAALLPDYPWVLGFYGIVLLPLAGLGKILRPFLRTSLLIIWPFALSLFIIQGLFTPGEILVQWGILSVKREGLLIAARYSARLLVWLGAVLHLMLVTRPDRLMLALTEIGLPRQIAYIVLSALQIIPRFQGRAQVILDAQRSRGLETEGNLLHRLRMLLPLVAPLILSSILELDERAIALEARGFSRQGIRTSYVRLIDSRPQKLLRWCLLILCLLGIAARLVGLINV
jgi:energy-coupling factor transport system permease protein